MMLNVSFMDSLHLLVMHILMLQIYKLWVLKPIRCVIHFKKILTSRSFCYLKIVDKH